MPLHDSTTKRLLNSFRAEISNGNALEALAIYKEMRSFGDYPTTLRNYAEDCLNKLGIGNADADLDLLLDPELHIDHIGSETVAGWVWSPKFPKISFDICLSVDGSPVQRSTANLYREDLGSHNIGSAYYGFNIKTGGTSASLKGRRLELQVFIRNTFITSFPLSDIDDTNSTICSVTDTDKLTILARNHKYFTSQGPLYEEHNVVSLPGRTPQKNHLLIIAFYLPQFYTFEINDKAWGTGFTEWRQLPRALPRYFGHYQPRTPRDLGFYNLESKEKITQQAQIAFLSGIDAFCFYYYCFGRERVLDKPLELFAADKDMPINFLIMWANENWTRTWDGLDDNTILSQDYHVCDEDWLVSDISRYLANPNYLRIDGRPLFIIYRPDLIPDPQNTIGRWRHLFKTNHDLDPLIFCVQGFETHDPRIVGCDGAIEFPPHKLASLCANKAANPIFSDFDTRVIEYDDFVNASISSDCHNKFPLIKTAVPSWDNEPRRPGCGFSLANATPYRFELWIEYLMRRALVNPVFNESIVAINAWNEWAESAYLEPDVHYGSAYLNACGRAKLKCIQESPKKPPANNYKVSAILPCFNHAHYLKQRLESVLNQSHPPSEIIFLDDASTDESLEIATEVLRECGIPYKIISNESNSGSAFSQWLKGLDECTYDLVWIAETDDYCDQLFLENILPHFDTLSVTGVMGRIDFVNNSGSVLPDANSYFNDLWFHTWHLPFALPAAKAFLYDLSVCNTIINASGFVFRKPLLNKNEKHSIVDLKFAGDWLFYAYLLRGGSLVYEPNAKSYFRKVETSASRSRFGSQVHLDEHRKIIQRISELYGYHDSWFRGHILRIAPFFQEISILELEKQLSPNLDSCTPPLKICIAAHSFSVGGGEVVPLQLANYLRSLGHHVTYLLLEKSESSEQDLSRLIRRDIPIVYFDEVESDINGFLNSYRFDIINSHNFGVEYHFCRLGARVACDWIVSMHGGHETVRHLLSSSYIEYVSSNVNTWLFLSRKNINALEEAGLVGARFIKTINGIDANDIKWESSQVTRRKYGIAPEELCVVLCSRAIPEKGWKMAIDIISKANEYCPRYHLFLIGSGPVYYELLQDQGLDRRVHLLGSIESPVKMFKAFDLALFPSTYSGETFPMFVVESLAAGLPVLATSVGEIPSMLLVDGDRPAGIVLDDSKDYNSLVDEFTCSLLEMTQDSRILDVYKDNARHASCRYTTECQVADLLRSHVNFNCNSLSK